MGNRQAHEYELQHIAQHLNSSNLNHISLPEDDSSYLPRTTPVLDFQSSCHIHSSSISISESSFSFKYDTTNPCTLTITPKLTALEQSDPDSHKRVFEIAAGLNQEFTGWALSNSANMPKSRSLELRIESSVPVLHSEITSVNFNKPEDLFSFTVDDQILRYLGKDFILKDVFGLNCDEENSECAVCLFNPRDTAVIPCNHLCLCAGCANILRLQTNKKCPLCRTEAKGLIKLKKQED